MVEVVGPALDDDAGGRGIGGEWAVRKKSRELKQRKNHHLLGGV